jgi:methionine-rich copper-binding protein CopC
VLEIEALEYRSTRLQDLYSANNPTTPSHTNSASRQVADPQPAGITPQIIDQTPAANTFGSVNTVEVTFNEPVNPDTFTADQVSLAGPQGPVAVDAVTPVKGSDNTQFDITFSDQTALGYYSLVIGPDIQDLNGTPMKSPYYGQFAILGPMVIGSAPAAYTSVIGQVNSIRVIFNEPMNPDTFTPEQVDYLIGPQGRIGVTGITPVSGSNNTQFDINFSPQGFAGNYTLAIGPDIQDMVGHQMDQNGNFVDGEFPDDLFILTFGLEGPRIISQSVNASLGAFHARVTFNEPMNPASFTQDQIFQFTGPTGDIPVLGVIPVEGSNFTQFDIVFPPQTSSGSYSMVLGPGVFDRFGNSLQGPYLLDFTLGGPRIVSSAPSGNENPGVDHLRVTFNYPIDRNSFTVDQIVEFTGPKGDIPITAVTAVPFTSDTQFDISFDSLVDLGDYRMVIGPKIYDIYGNPLNGPYTALFSIVDSGARPIAALPIRA